MPLDDVIQRLRLDTTDYEGGLQRASAASGQFAGHVDEHNAHAATGYARFSTSVRGLAFTLGELTEGGQKTGLALESIGAEALHVAHGLEMSGGAASAAAAAFLGTVAPLAAIGTAIAVGIPLLTKLAELFHDSGEEARAESEAVEEAHQRQEDYWDTIIRGRKTAAQAAADFGKDVADAEEASATRRKEIARATHEAVMAGIRANSDAERQLAQAKLDLAKATSGPAQSAAQAEIDRLEEIIADEHEAAKATHKHAAALERAARGSAEFAKALGLGVEQKRPTPIPDKFAGPGAEETAMRSAMPRNADEISRTTDAAKLLGVTSEKAAKQHDQLTRSMEASNKAAAASAVGGAVLAALHGKSLGAIIKQIGEMALVKAAEEAAWAATEFAFGQADAAAKHGYAALLWGAVGTVATVTGSAASGGGSSSGSVGVPSSTGGASARSGGGGGGGGTRRVDISINLSVPLGGRATRTQAAREIMTQIRDAAREDGMSVQDFMSRAA